MINNALSGLAASQAALDVASQNIANLQTPGYTRQAALLAAVRSSTGQRRAAGNGVEVTSIMRVTDLYKTQQMWQTASTLGRYAPAQTYLSQLERVMGDDGASLSRGIDNFFEALNAVAGVDPTSTPLRQQVVTAASAMSQRFNNMNNVFDAQATSVNQQRSAIVSGVNATLANLASLNRQIVMASATGTSHSALLDARDQAIDSLATQLDVEVIQQPDGSRNISLASGQALVIGGTHATVIAGAGAVQTFTLRFGGMDYALDPVAVGGELGGLGAFERDILQPLRAGVSDLALELSSRINTQLAAGFTMSGAPGSPLFQFTAGGGADMLQVAAGFQTGDLAFSADGAPGDSGNLQRLIDIRLQPVNITGLGAVMLADADTQLTGKLAVDSARNRASLDTSETIRQQAVADWKSTSGVNQDEEAVNLLEFQKLYQANLKVLSVANSLFDATLAMIA